MCSGGYSSTNAGAGAGAGAGPHRYRRRRRDIEEMEELEEGMVVLDGEMSSPRMSPRAVPPGLRAAGIPFSISERKQPNAILASADCGMEVAAGIPWKHGELQPEATEVSAGIHWRELIASPGRIQPCRLAHGSAGMREWREARWQRNVRGLQAFLLHEGGHYPRRDGTDKDEVFLAGWIHVQKRAHRHMAASLIQHGSPRGPLDDFDDHMTARRAALLERLPGWGWKLSPGAR